VYTYGREGLMVKKMSTREVRENFSEVIGSVYFTREPVVIERNGKPYAVLVNAEEYERQQDEQRTRALEDLASLVERIHERNADLDPESVYQNITSVVEEVRREKQRGA